MQKVRVIPTPTMFMLGFGYIPGTCFALQLPCWAIVYYFHPETL